jgi:non-heme chloroperoxidase
MERIMLAQPTQTARLASGLSLDYVRQGPEGEIPLVFLHGFTDSCRSFSRLFAALPTTIDAIAVTLRGHGGSDRPAGPYDIATMARDVAQLLDRLAIRKILLVGHCMGGFVAQRFALDYPDRLDRLILLDSFPTMIGNADVAALLEEVAGFADGPVDPDFVRAFQEGTVAEPVPAAFMDMIVAESLRLPGQTWRTVLAALVAEDLTEALPQIGVPTLLICGDEDMLFGLSSQRVLLAGLPDAELVMLPGVGHSPHWEDPAMVAALCCDFAARPAAAGLTAAMQE